jgi:tetratricopeptide (TPR) repeat protein
MQHEWKDPSLMAYKKQRIELPSRIQEQLDEYLDELMETEKEVYQSDIVPFQQHEKKIRESAKASVQDMLEQLDHGDQLISEILVKEEQNNPNIPPEARYNQFLEKFNQYSDKMFRLGVLANHSEIIQEKAGIDWAFMDRVYAIAKKLVIEEKYEDALSVFKWLTLLNYEVFEYVFGQATCLYALGSFDKAYDVYLSSLVLQPTNPLCLFQVAMCLYQIHEVSNSLEVLKKCIEYAKLDQNAVELLSKATEIQEQMEKEQAA